ncbi:MAG: iron-containing alcohol dehydrogenase, partial [Alphaproteobacteria bacterium]|nr:iron-containing alcohol dehydrogenase [Alphaproteobacteria bacterium]
NMTDVDYVVALGGGSSIDAAKAMIALHGTGHDEDLIMKHLSSGVPISNASDFIPLIAIPTTSGTGAEVTRWGTIWGDAGIKFSISDERLYPQFAVLDPDLCISMSPEITLSTGLDALSHALESIWNRNHSILSDTLAVQAIVQVRKNLSIAYKDPADKAARSDMQHASLLAGLAMGTTQTALAHSISYPFTSMLGLPHGFACSFTLPEIARFNGEVAPERINLISQAFETTNEKLPDTMNAWFSSMGLGGYILKYVPKDFLETLKSDLITRSRAANNIRDVDSEMAMTIAGRSLNDIRA